MYTWGTDLTLGYVPHANISPLRIHFEAIGLNVGISGQNVGATGHNVGATGQNVGATGQNVGATGQDMRTIGGHRPERWGLPARTWRTPRLLNKQ